MCSRRDANCSDGNLDSVVIVARGREDLDLLRERAPRFLPSREAPALFVFVWKPNVKVSFPSQV